MRIGINICSFSIKDEEWNEMVKMLFQHMAKNCPAHQYIFIVGKKSTKDIQTSTNVSTVVLSEPLNNALSLKLWYDYKLPAIFKRHKIDAFISPNGICSLRSNIPQIILLKDLLIQSFSKVKNNRFIKKRLQKSLVKSTTIIVFSASEKLQLLERYPLAEAKIITANLFASSIFQPKEWREKDLIKDKYSEGKEYFLYNMNENNVVDLVTLLKAFSLFKKRQQSNMQLLLVGEINKAANSLATKMETYKYKDEVKMFNFSTENEMFDVFAAAYALLHFSNVDVDLPILNAMQTGVPIIVLKNNIAPEIPASITLYANANNAESIAEQMKIIYKDENQRNRMIVAGLEIAKENTVENASAQTWQAIAIN